jgi:hypothetical protein
MDAAPLSVMVPSQLLTNRFWLPLGVSIAYLGPADQISDGVVVKK